MKTKHLNLILLGIIFATHARAYDAAINGIYYNLNTETKEATVTSGNSKYTGICSIPPSITYNNKNYVVKEIGSRAFDKCNGLTSINIPNTVTTIGYYAFGYCSGLESINIPNSVTDIGSCAFYGCVGLTSVIIPNSVTTIHNSTFDGCTGLSSVTIPNSVTYIGSSAFYDCRSLTSVIIPNGVTYIGAQAFNSPYSSLTSVVSLMETPCTSTFFNLPSTCTLTIPYGTRDAYIAAGWTESYFKGGIIEMPNPYSITIGSAGVATFCSTKNLDFSGTDDVKAYIVSTFTPSTGEVTLTRVRDVPANTGLVLIGAEGSYEIPEGTGETIVSNMLKGVTIATTMNKVDGDYTNYIMAKKNGETGFFAVKDGSTLGAGKAYLPLPTASLPHIGNAGVRLLFVDGEETTGVETVEVSDSAESDGIYYNLQGQPVEKPSSGIYIVNGKKVWIK